MNSDRLKRAFRALTGTPEIAFLPRYDVTILKDHGDNHVDVQFDDQRFANHTRVPVRTATPGAKIKVKEGARALLEYEAGRPSKPYISFFGSGTLELLEIAGAGAMHEVAYKTGKIKLTLYLAPDLVPKISTIPGAYPDPFLGPIPLIPLEVTGEIIDGSNVVKVVI